MAETPPDSVVKALRRAGLREVVLPDGVPSLWLVPGTDRAVPWVDMLLWMADAIADARAVALARPYWRTSEFWLAVSTLVGTAATGMLALAESDAVGPLTGTVAAVAAVVMPVLYKLSRAKEKEIAAQEAAQARLLGATQPPRTPSDGGQS